MSTWTRCARTSRIGKSPISTVDRIGTTCWIEASDPPDSFPNPELALDDNDGLLAIGGDLSIPRLLAAYRKGIFPWYDSEWQPILWWSPNPRAVLFTEELHVSRSLRRTLRKNIFTVSIDRAEHAAS